MPLVADKDGALAQRTYNYMRIIGMLQYLQGHSNPDLMYSISQCAQFIHSRKHSHEESLERIGQYLKKTMNYRLVLKTGNTLDLDCYINADFISDI